MKQLAVIILAASIQASHGFVLPKIIPSTTNHPGLPCRLTALSKTLYSVEEDGRTPRSSDRHTTRASVSVTSSSSASVFDTTDNALDPDVGGPQSDPALEFVHPGTNCTVVLLGCLHGSTSSASDVRRVLNGGGRGAATTDAVVLELCASRFADLRRDMDRAADRRQEEEEEEEKTSERDGGRGGSLGGWLGRIGRFADVISQTSAKRGLSTGIAAAVLGGTAGVQTALSGFEPGREFVTALEVVRDMEGGRCDVVLADRTVDETLRRVGMLPSVSADMTKGFFENGVDWDGTYGVDAKHLKTALWGDEALGSQQVDVGRVLTREGAVRDDLVRLTLPPLLFIEVVATVVQSWVDVLTGGDGVVLPDANDWKILIDSCQTLSIWDVASGGLQLSQELLTSALVLGLGYVTLALPAARLVLRERDDYLARGIEAACNLASAPSGVDSEPLDGDLSDRRGRVVAVLGLLHVNGVAQRLLSGKPNPR